MKKDGIQTRKRKPKAQSVISGEIQSPSATNATMIPEHLTPKQAS